MYDFVKIPEREIIQTQEKKAFLRESALVLTLDPKIIYTYLCLL